MWRSSFDLCQFQWLYYCECVFQCVSGIWFLLKTSFNRLGTRFYYGWDNAEQIDSKFWKTRRIKVALRRREDIAIKKERQGNLFSLSCVLRLAASPSVLFDNGKLLAPPVDVDLSCPARIWDGGWPLFEECQLDSESAHRTKGWSCVSLVPVRSRRCSSLLSQVVSWKLWILQILTRRETIHQDLPIWWNLCRSVLVQRSFGGTAEGRIQLVR